MRLRIRKDQEDMKGRVGEQRGVVFRLTTLAEISSEERALIDRYKLGYYTLAAYAGKGGELRVTVEALLLGLSTESEDIGLLLELESKIRSGCESLKGLLLAMSAFRGEEVHEI